MSANRIDKLLTASGFVSRSEAKEYVKQGRVSVNGNLVLAPDEKYDGERDTIFLDGVQINCRQFRYFIMNKPAGLLSATEDHSQITVIDILPLELQRLNLFPIGRLDKDTTGLLLLTNDGELSHKVISPKYHVAKTYIADLEYDLEPDNIIAFEKGIILSDGTLCLPAELKIINNRVAKVIVFEGKYHQVKRMFAAIGNHVLHLHRVKIGELALEPTLAEGNYRELSDSEIKLLFE